MNSAVQTAPTSPARVQLMKAGGLFRRTAEIEDEPVPPFLHLQLDLVGAVFMSVVVQKIHCAIDSVREALQAALQPFRERD